MQVLVTALPVIVLNTEATLNGAASAASAPLGVVDWVGIVLWAIGFVLEVAADVQKNAFRANAANKGRFISSGVWSWSRHPNYVGEITLWLGQLVLCCSGFERARDWVCIVYVP